MDYPSPADVLRLELGREEFCQRLLTTLIVGGTYPRWNTRSTPSPSGRRFLGDLYELSFAEPPATPAEVFVDELDLPRRVETEPGGAPDWAVLWPDRVWIVELKTEPGSHRQTQIPYYFELGAHHYPGSLIDITYLTGPLEKPAPTCSEGQRYAHLTWTRALPMVRAIWGSDPDPAVRAYVDALESVIRELPTPWAAQREQLFGTPSAPEPPDQPGTPEPTPHEHSALTLRGAIEATAADGRQRGVPSDAGSLEDVLTLRHEARRLIDEAPTGSVVKRVRPWLWSGQEQTSGKPLTPNGERYGYELRLSRYQKPIA